MIIYRSSNAPIVIEFDTMLDDITEIQVALYSDNNSSKLIQCWTEDNLEKLDNFLIIHLTQKETSSYPVGLGHLEVKYLDIDKMVHFLENIHVIIKTNNNLDILGEDDKTNFFNILPDKKIVSVTNRRETNAAD